MELFVLSDVCKSNVHCETCRNKNSKMRIKWHEIYELPNNETDFECPYGKDWGYIKSLEPIEIKDNKIQVRPNIPSFGQMKTFTEAIFTGEYVDEETVKKRMEICDKCEYQKIDPKNSDKFCGICGCGTTAEARSLKNLAAYKENLPKWGCKFPSGSKWTNLS